MLIVNDVMEIARLSSLSNLAIAKNDNAVMKFIYLGISELFRRFNLSIKVESVITNPDLALYELRSPDISLLLCVYNSQAQELQQSDVLGGDFDYKMINYKSFMLKYPKHDLVFAVYKASAPPITSPNDEIPLPDAMVDALLTYVAYMGHSTINKDNVNEASAYSIRFEKACESLENQGYKIPINAESVALQVRGYV